MRLFVSALLVAALCACASDPQPADPAAAYCAVVERTADAMASDAAVKRPAMAERRDAAPDEIRADWDTVFQLEPMDPTTRQLAQDRIDRYDDQHC